MRRLLFGSVLAAAVLGCNDYSPQGPLPASPPPAPPPAPASPYGASVLVIDNAYSPSAVTIRVGSAVQWINDGASSHYVKADNGSFVAGPLRPHMFGGATGGGTPAGTYSRVFSNPGTFTYHCTLHPGMTGSVTVTGP